MTVCCVALPLPVKSLVFTPEQLGLLSSWGFLPLSRRQHQRGSISPVMSVLLSTLSIQLLVLLIKISWKEPPISIHGAKSNRLATTPLLRRRGTRRGPSEPLMTKYSLENSTTSHICLHMGSAERKHGCVVFAPSPSLGKATALVMS